MNFFEPDFAWDRHPLRDRIEAQARIVGGAHDGQELRELTEEWDGGGGFAALLDEASDAQLVAFADMVRDAIQHRVTHYQRHERDTRARVLFEVAIKRFGHTLRW
jgi:hypothetical protein